LITQQFSALMWINDVQFLPGYIFHQRKPTTLRQVEICLGACHCQDKWLEVLHSSLIVFSRWTPEWTEDKQSSTITWRRFQQDGEFSAAINTIQQRHTLDVVSFHTGFWTSKSTGTAELPKVDHMRVLICSLCVLNAGQSVPQLQNVCSHAIGMRANAFVTKNRC
jgi:hypothetical protein